MFLRSPQFALLAAGLSYNPDGTVEFHGFNAFEEPAYGPGASNDGGSANMYRQAQVEAYRNSGAVKNSLPQRLAGREACMRRQARLLRHDGGSK